MIMLNRILVFNDLNFMKHEFLEIVPAVRRFIVFFRCVLLS